VKIELFALLGQYDNPTQDAQKAPPARPQRVEQVEIEIKVDQKFNIFSHLDLDLSLNLPESCRAFPASC
jgi:hypothetical protein